MLFRVVIHLGQFISHRNQSPRSDHVEQIWETVSLQNLVQTHSPTRTLGVATNEDCIFCRDSPEMLHEVGATLKCVANCANWLHVTPSKQNDVFFLSYIAHMQHLHLSVRGVTSQHVHVTNHFPLTFSIPMLTITFSIPASHFSCVPALIKSWRVWLVAKFRRFVPLTSQDFFTHQFAILR